MPVPCMREELTNNIGIVLFALFEIIIIRVSVNSIAMARLNDYIKKNISTDSGCKFLILCA